MEKIELVPFQETDIEKLISWVDRPNASDLWASRTYPYPLTRAMVEKHFQKTKNTPTELLIFKIINSEKKTIGHVELDKFDHHCQSVRITRLFIDEHFRGKRFAKQAIEQLLDYAFSHLKMNRIEIMAVEHNQIAFNIYKSLGFIFEGVLRENMFLSGKKYNSAILSMLKSDYKKLD